MEGQRLLGLLTKLVQGARAQEKPAFAELRESMEGS